MVASNRFMGHGHTMKVKVRHWTGQGSRLWDVLQVWQDSLAELTLQLLHVFQMLPNSKASDWFLLHRHCNKCGVFHTRMQTDTCITSIHILCMCLYIYYTYNTVNLGYNKLLRTGRFICYIQMFYIWNWPSTRSY